MISFLSDMTEAQSEIKSKISGMRGVLLSFADQESPLVNEIAKATIFNGQAKSSLNVRTGKTRGEGLLLRRVKKFSGKSNFAGEAYWSRMTNIFDNLKERKRKSLLRALKTEFEKDGQVQRIFDGAMKDFEAVK